MSRQLDEQGLEASEREVLRPVRLRALQAREPAQQRAERELCLQPPQRCAQAEVCPHAESQVAVVLARTSTRSGSGNFGASG